MALGLWLLLSLLLLASVAATTNECVCQYDPTVDYFPVKLQPTHSRHFKIEYFKSYKKLTVMDGSSSGREFVTYGYLCGTPPPPPLNNSSSEAAALELPIKSAAVTSIMFMSLLEYLGVRHTVHSVGRSYESYKPCLRKMYDEGQVTDASTGMEFQAINQTAFARTGRGLDVVFMDNFSFLRGRLVDDVKRELPGTQPVYIAEQVETTAFGKLDWLKFMAALYNKEHAVAPLFAQIEAKYECVKALALSSSSAAAAAGLAQPKRVLWGYCYYSVQTKRTDCYVAVCPNYYCDWIRDAGGELLKSKQAVTPDELFALAHQADVWFYTNSNWNESSLYSRPFYDGALRDQFAQLDVVRNQQVYDILGTNWSDWFEDDKTEPVVMLMDLVQILHAGEDDVISHRRPKFFRNVFTDPPAYQDERLASECVNETAPVHIESYTGFCAAAAAAAAAGEEGDAAEDKVLCPNEEPLVPPPPPEQSAVSFSVAFLAVLAVLAGLGACTATMGTMPPPPCKLLLRLCRQRRELLGQQHGLDQQGDMEMRLVGERSFSAAVNISNDNDDEDTLQRI